MALFDDKEKYLFAHLYKCGGNSLRLVLDKYSLEKLGYDYSSMSKEEIVRAKYPLNPKATFGEQHGVHAHARDVQEHYIKNGKEEIFDQMFKFTIVRNPFDFLLSTYYYARKFRNHYMHKTCISIPFVDFPAYYLRVMKDHKKTRPYGSNKVTSLYDWILDKNGENIFDFIGKLENIDQDSKIIMDKIGIEHVPIPVVNVNKMNSKPYREVYNNKSRAYVEKYFAKDLEYFEYEF